MIDGRTCADGGVIDNLPAAIASYGMQAMICVDVGSTSIVEAQNIRGKGFAAIYMRAAQTMMRTLQLGSLKLWAGPPLLLVRPEVWRYGWFSFANTPQMIEAGYRAMNETLDQAGEDLMKAGGVYPRRHVEISIDRAACIGCRVCATLAHELIRMDDSGKAVVTTAHSEWSRADGDFVYQCPTKAIKVVALEGDVRRNTMEWRGPPDSGRSTTSL
jgi:NTE family protein